MRWARCCCGSRRPFGDGPSSRQGDVVAVSVGDRSRRPFGDGPSSRRFKPVAGSLLVRRSPSLRGRPFIEASPAWDRRVSRSRWSPSLRGRPFIEAYAGVDARRPRSRGRRPFGDGPSSRLRRACGLAPVGGVAVPSGTALHRGIDPEAELETSSKVAVPSGTALHRGTYCDPAQPVRPRVAVPSGTALHRGLIHHTGTQPRWGSPSLRGRPFIEALAAARRGAAGRPVAVPSGTALHRGMYADDMSPFSVSTSPSLRGRPFIEARCG